MDNKSVTQSKNTTDNPSLTSVTSVKKSVAQCATNQLRLELEVALQDLQQKGETLASNLNASIEFILGWDDYNNYKIAEAIAHYHQSLSLYQNSPHSPIQNIRA